MPRAMRHCSAILASLVALGLSSCGGASVHHAASLTCTGGISERVQHCIVTRPNGEAKHVTVTVPKGTTDPLGYLTRTLLPSARPPRGTETHTGG
jgi:hypothetical protein